MQEKTGDSLEGLETMTRSAILSGDEQDNLAALVPGLTILAHPDIRRIGERSALVLLANDQEVEISRLTPLFAQPGEGRRRPIADPHVSRSAIRLQSTPGTGVELSNGFGLRASVGGEPLGPGRRLSDSEIQAGVVILIAERVALLLHMMEVVPAAEPNYGLVGESLGMRELRRQIKRVADLDVPVLLRGETGTGKELVASSIFKASRRHLKPMVAVNMGAVPPTLAAAELFGSLKGSFTGADRRRIGYFTEADGGTLFLDEIGETPSEVQPLLLRTLETGIVRAVGSETDQRVDVRILAATDADLEQEIEAGRFRAPLLHRLSGYEIRLPPLRERLEDIPRLLVHFLRLELAMTGESWRLESPDGRRPWLSASVILRFLDFPWPGNIRQLRNAARQLLIANRGADRLTFSAELQELFSSTENPDPKGRQAESPHAESPKSPTGPTPDASAALSHVDKEIPVGGAPGKARFSTDTGAPRPSSSALKPVVKTLVAVHWRGSKEIADPGIFRLYGQRDRLLRGLLVEYDGHEIERSDGFLLLFGRPVDALGYALELHEGLAGLSEECGAELGATVGILVGEIFLRTNASSLVARGARRFDVEGVAKQTVRQLAAAAMPGQTLLNQSAFDLARQALDSDHPLRDESVKWLHHGTSHLEQRRLEIFEVGVEGEAPLSRPETWTEPEAERPAYRSPHDIGEEELIRILRHFSFRLQPAAKALGISRTSLYALIDKSPHIRKAREIPAAEIEASRGRHGGDRDAMAAELGVSRKGLSRRMTELGL